MKFTQNAIEEIKELNLEREFTFYTDYDWSTPIGCIIEQKAVVYAYRVNDEAATIFTQEFGKGSSTFIGPRYGFYSLDADIFTAFLRHLILSSLN